MARSRIGALGLPALVGVVVGLGGWLVGVVVADAVLLAVLVTLVLVVPRWAGLPETFGWPNVPEHTTAAGWYEVRRLASALQRPNDRRELFAMRVVPHLRAVAEGRLARLGVDWRDPAAVRLLGPDVHALLDDPAGTADPTHPVGTLAVRSAASRPSIELTEFVLARLDEIPDELPDPPTRSSERGRPQHHEPGA